MLKVVYETYGDCNYGDYDDDSSLDDSNSSESGQEYIYNYFTRILDIIDYKFIKDF
jgi:hypothetical protein